MVKKKKGRAERLKQRIVKRRISKLIELGLIVGVLTLELVIGRLPDSTDWIGTPLYYGLVFAVLLIGFWVIWVFEGEKTDLDELEYRMEQLFDKQLLAINRNTKAINRLTKKIEAKIL